jgi:hypothetical protein
MKRFGLLRFFIVTSILIIGAGTGFFLPRKKFTDITQKGYEQYQDIIINSQVVKKASGRHDCESRYRLIQQVLAQYKRPFVMLDIGAAQGYYSFRAAHDYDAVSVMIEGDNPHYPYAGKQLFELCKANDQIDRIIFLNKPVVIEDLQRLGECESFGVVLAMNIIHWFGPRWKEAADAILNLGDNIIIETPPQEEIVSAEENALRQSIEDYILTKNPTILGKAPRHSSNTFATLYWIGQEKQKLSRKTWILPKDLAHAYEIRSNFISRTMTKVFPHADDIKIHPWVAGINLLTFKMYHGAFPSSETIKTALKKLSHVEHNDWTINNMILQGKEVVLIDENDPAHGLQGGRKCTKSVLKAHCKILDLEDPSEVERYFWHSIIRASGKH